MYTVQVIQYTVDFDFKDSKLENINKLKKYFISKILIFTKLPLPHS